METPEGFLFVRPLGAGGMGEVNEVERAGVRYALKMFSAEGPNRRLLCERFRTESRLLTKLSHPNLVRVHGYGECGGVPYCLMDPVLNAHGEPETLEDARKGHRFSEADAEGWFAKLRSALAYCHAQGVVHRDVKLENVLLDKERHAMLADFGVARILDRELREALKVQTTFVTGETTGTKPVMGTYWYLAPELRKGGPATPASDWYALGVLFFRLLTGLWYESGTDALDLLAPYGDEWRTLLGGLLSADPEVRARAAVGGLRSKRSRPVVRLVIAAACFAAIVVGIGSLGVTRTVRGSATAAGNDAPEPAETCTVGLKLEVSPDVRFVFRSCPPGTNLLDGLALPVTRPYALSETPVTWRQWKTVTGDGFRVWPGGEDAPVTYVTYEAVTNFCAGLSRRFSSVLPKGYEVRLPTVGEWRLAFENGGTASVTNGIPDVAVGRAGKPVQNDTERNSSRRRAVCGIGWFGQAFNGEPVRANCREWYYEQGLRAPRVKYVWPEFPPRVINPGMDDWVRNSLETLPVPVGLKPVNALGLHDMWGNCFEMLEAAPVRRGASGGRPSSDVASLFRRRARLETEWGYRIDDLSFLVNGGSRTQGEGPLMIGECITPGLPGDELWSSRFPRLPHLGFRLCIGPKR